MNEWLKDDERLDYLLAENLRIIQSPSVFSFSLDAVLLSRFASVPKRGAVVDLCSGNGVIPLFLSARTNAKIIGVELQPRLYDMACRSVAYNKLEEQIEMKLGDVKEVPNEIGIEKYDRRDSRRRFLVSFCILHCSFSILVHPAGNIAKFLCVLHRKTCVRLLFYTILHFDENKHCI